MKKLSFLLTVFILLLSLKFAAQKNGLQKIVTADRSQGDGFGWAVSVSGDYAVAGSVAKSKVLNEAILKEAGAAYIFKRESSGKWTEMQKLEPGVIKADDYFGGSVSINGIYAVVGSCGEDNAKESDAGIRMGAVYVYSLLKGKWIKVQKLELAKKEKQDNFGYSVSVSEKYIVIGCPGRNMKQGNFSESSGAVYVYEISKSGWIPMQEIVASPGSGFWFGRTVSVSGNNLVVGTANGGRVSVYEVENGRWTLKSTLKATEAADIGFGTAIGIWNTKLIVGADGDYDYFEGAERPNTDSVMEIMNEEANGQFTKLILPNNKQLRDSFGVKPEQFKSLAKPVETLEARKKRMAGAGAVYIYNRAENGNWILEERIVPKGISNDDHFGASVNISDSLVIVGSPGDKIKGKAIKDNYYAGAVYVYKKNKEGKWLETKKITASKRNVLAKFGLATGLWQKRIIIGARYEAGDAAEKAVKPEAGAAYICDEK